MKTIYRQQVPVDDKIHSFAIPMFCEILRVSALGNDVVEFWYEQKLPVQQLTHRRGFRVVGTGHNIQDDYTWRGTCQRTPSGLVWHLYEVGLSEVR